jgi:endonuclease G
MATLEEERKAQGDAADARVRERKGERQRKVDLLGEWGGIAEADDPQRIATRIDRLSRYHPDIRPISASDLAAEEPDAMKAAGIVLERIINTADFLGVAYLEAGVAAERAVGRVSVRDERGRLTGYGTGSLVSPQLLLTNHHVLPDAQTASWSIAEFDYQDGPDGRIKEPRALDLDPERFFVAHKQLDFALVAVKATPAELAQFGFNRLIPAEGKAIIGDFVSIVQHPRGEKKQVALRENRIVDLLEDFIHYSTDTEPGSSGSPVFNDQWEVVALHHAGVSAPEHQDLGGIVNEGIRVSRLVDFLTKQNLSAGHKELLDQMLNERSTPSPDPMSQTTLGTLPSVTPTSRAPSAESLDLEVPVRIRVSAGDVSASSAEEPMEAIVIDPDYTSRTGYDPSFLGTAALEVPLPTLANGLLELAAINNQATEEPPYVLTYHHYSVVLNKERRLAFLTAVNIDGATHFREDLRRESDRWVYDPRLPREEQTGEAVYASNPLDRGHLIRRLDPGWGATLESAKLATDDTFHFTNCTPQHKDFNQNRTTWAGLEDYVLYNADNLDFKVSVFTGPVFANDDDEYRGVALPRQYWKVVTMVKGSGLSATGYLLSQKDLITGLEIATEDFSYGAYKTFQVPVSKIQDLTRLGFGALVDADPLAHQGEAAIVPTEITRPQQLTL